MHGRRQEEGHGASLFLLALFRDPSEYSGYRLQSSALKKKEKSHRVEKKPISRKPPGAFPLKKEVNKKGTQL